MDSLEPVVHALKSLREREAFKQVRLAEARAEPPPLAFMVGFSSLVAVIRGRFSIEFSQQGETRNCTLGPNEVLAVPANCWYRPTWQYPNTTLTFLFGKRQIGLSLVTVVVKTPGEPTYSNITKFHTSYPLSGPLQRILQACEDLGREQGDGPALRHVLKGLVISCVESMKRPAPDSKGKAHHLYQTLCSYIQSHFHEPLTRESIAEVFGVSPNHVSRVFQQEGMMRFWNYVMMVRIDRAKYLLRMYKLSIKEIALRCGYDDPDYFCKMFRSKVRMSPLEYRIKYSDSAASELTIAG